MKKDLDDWAENNLNKRIQADKINKQILQGYSNLLKEVRGLVSLYEKFLEKLESLKKKE